PVANGRPVEGDDAAEDHTGRILLVAACTCRAGGEGRRAVAPLDHDAIVTGDELRGDVEGDEPRARNGGEGRIGEAPGGPEGSGVPQALGEVGGPQRDESRGGNRRQREGLGEEYLDEIRRRRRRGDPGRPHPHCPGDRREIGSPRSSGVAVEHGTDGTACWYRGVQAHGLRLPQEPGAGNRWVAGEDVPARI